MFSILHISDLHRSPNEPVDNESLIAALLADRDRYMSETPLIPSPDAIVVSGDLIRGAQIDLPNWEQAIDEQYNVSQDFLDHLARRFLDGDRSKLIIIPGNHDVCWNTSFAAMELVPDSEYPRDVKQALIQPDSIYRWSWMGRGALYRIRDTALYNNRLNAYWDFAERFYEGVSIFMPIDRHRGFQLFELHDRRIVLAAFDSITDNDCFNHSGAIPRRVVAESALTIRDIQHLYDLRIAVWHHSMYGPPKHDDYLDDGQVREMAGLGFQFGMHGHHHVADAKTHYIHLTESHAMAVSGAGSLCAGTRELPRGVNRQYNLIVIEDDLRSARVHVREICEGEQFSRKSSGIFFQGFVELRFHANSDLMGREVNAREENIRRTVLLAEEELRTGHAKKAIELLNGIDLSPASHARKIAIQAAIDLEDWNLIVSIITEPKSSEEAIILVSALIATNALDQAYGILNRNHNIDAAIRGELEGRIEMKKMMRS